MVAPLLCLFCLFLFGCDFRLHRFYQLCEIFLALLPRGSVDIFGDSFPVHARGKSALVEVVVYHRHATRTGLAYLALIRLKFRFCRLIGCFTLSLALSVAFGSGMGVSAPAISRSILAAACCCIASVIWL